MAKSDTINSSELKMPTPGNLSHLEYLALHSTDVRCETLADYLSATQAARSLGLFIKRFRTYRPMETSYIDLDHRVVEDKKLVSRFTGSIYRNRHDPDKGHIALAGEESETVEGVELKREYGALIPTRFNFTHDPTRPSEAVFRHSENGAATRQVFNEAADPKDYPREHDPAVLAAVVRQAAYDLIKIIGFTPGEIPKPPEITPLPKERITFSEDYLQDDPDEFLMMSDSGRIALYGASPNIRDR